MNRSFFMLMIALFCVAFVPDTKAQVLWYNQPAADWNEALPVGNGRMGAMVYGKAAKEQIQFNEESLWAGSHIDNNNPQGLAHLKEIQQLLLNGKNAEAYKQSTKYLLATPPRFRSYQTFGDVLLDFGEIGAASNYKRSLNIEDGIATTEFRAGKVTYKREVFASAPQNCIVIRVSVDQPGMLQCKVNLSREKDASVVALDDYSLLMTGQIMDVTDSVNGSGGAGMKFNSLLKAITDGGTTRTINNSILIENATAFTLILTAATDYHFSRLDFDRSIDPRSIVEQIVQQAEHFSYRELKEKHLAEYQSLFNRVSFHLGGPSNNQLPTDKRLENFRKGVKDNSLIALYFQFGRYLLMSSSRAPGVLPANLQGVWNEFYIAPWNSDYHTNINLQMNYWPAEITNLSETVTPLIHFIDNYRVPGRVTAKDFYGAEGWTMHHATDIFGKTGVNAGIHWGMSPLSAAWLCAHLWEHYLFTGNKEFLQNTAWPIMKEAARFIQSFLIKDKQGRMVTAPSMSPENTFIMKDGTKSVITYSPAIDIETIQTFYRDCIDAAGILKTDKAFIKSLKNTLQQLPPVKVSKRYGIIQEWIEDYEEAEPGHRHMSQLIGLYPFNVITPQTPELFAAAKRTIERRLQHGGGHTGWSRAWMVNFYARLLDGEKAYENVVALLQKSTLNNLLDTHPPFQIDGNFGGTAGIAEMLLQSQNGTIQLLPALPAEWASGEIKGLVARGGFVVDIHWENGRPQNVTVLSKLGGDCQIRFGDKIVKLKTKPGGSYHLDKW